MKAIPILLSGSLFLAALQGQSVDNPQIDYGGFVRLAGQLHPVRQNHLVDEATFLRMAAEPGTVILDARSRDKFENIHVKGARHLALTDFTENALRALIPDTHTRILIYCNNNFANEPANFACKNLSVALNIQTFINLHAYGYRNVYELGPYLDVRRTKIPFEGTAVPR